MFAPSAQPMQGHQCMQGHQSTPTGSINMRSLTLAAAAAGWMSPRSSVSPRAGGRAVSSEPLGRCPQPPSSGQRSQHSASPRVRLTALLEKSLKNQQLQNQEQNLEQTRAMANALLQVFASTDEAFAAFDTSHKGCLTLFQWSKGLLDYRIDLEQAVGIDAKQAFALLDPAHKGHVTRFGWRSFFDIQSVRSIADIVLPQGRKPLGGTAPRLRNVLAQQRCLDQGLDEAEVTSPFLSPSMSARVGDWAACARHSLPPAIPGAKRSTGSQERKSVTGADVANLCQQVIANCGSLDAAFEAFDVNGNGKITRVLFDSALAALKVDPESSLGLKPTRLFALMSFGEGRINRANWDRFWEENGVDLKTTVDVPDDQNLVVRRKAWKAVKLASTTCSGILQRRHELQHADGGSMTEDVPLTSNAGRSTQSVGPEQEVLESMCGNAKINGKMFSNYPDGSLNHHDLSDDPALKSNAGIEGPEGTIHLPFPPSGTPDGEGHDSLMVRRRMSLRRFMGKELSGDSSCESSNKYLNDDPALLSTDEDVPGSSDRGFSKVGCCQQDPMSPTYASTRSPSTATDRSMCSTSTFAPDDTSECDLQSMPSTPLLGPRPSLKLSSCPQIFQQDIREELSSLAAGERRTYGAGMTAEHLTILQRELKLRGIPFEITGEGAALRIEIIGSASLPSAQDISSAALRNDPSVRDGSSGSGSTMLPSIESPSKFPLEDTDHLAALLPMAFAAYASSPGLCNGSAKVFRKADLAGLVQKLRKSDNADWPRRRRFIKSASGLERLFDEALELQIDMKGRSTAGLTVEFFQVYIQMCSAKLGWSASSLLFALVDDLDCIHRERLGCA
eukprot:gnl/MRDRNA2_/MRDRNA2_78776_c1_seq1.p1 gnl/MRDRNA2_/MRDRNA2_78776_c1~~gnl/MRDRNA2_/MRDRNA2_78776_c1_seq1.p1  ORF type:complete len:845 (+),score=159.57 gnl/MRDRNA2_/MRDRNA2_78776_c1_seq1:51-2585(+)